MTLADEAIALSRRPGRPCGVEALEPELRAEVDKALAAGISSASLARALRHPAPDSGRAALDITEGVITRHVRRDCSCRS